MRKIVTLAFCLLIAVPVLAMGSKPEPKYNVEITKMEVVSPLATFETMSSKKALIVSTGYYKEIKEALEAKGFAVTVVAKTRDIKAKNYDCIVVVGSKLGEAALGGLK